MLDSTPQRPRKMTLTSQALREAHSSEASSSATAAAAEAASTLSASSSSAASPRKALRSRVSPSDLKATARMPASRPLERPTSCTAEPSWPLRMMA